jgi:hypothetical protein
MYDRMAQYVEQNDLRAVVQCGFRPDHSTLDALFTMLHLLSKHQHAKQPLYVCYVDFAKAFDMVRREEMVRRAEQLGMSGPFLAALQQWFDNSRLQVHVNGQHGETFDTFRGIKQGSRLSPLCFGLFIEQLHEMIQLQLPGAGPVVGALRVPAIMYADDIKLLATTAEELQQLLDCLWVFCQLFDMRVNVSPHKTCIVMYGTAPRKHARSPTAWKLGDTEVPVCTSYKDLGITCLSAGARRRGPQQGELLAGVQTLAQAGRRAMHAVLGMCKRKGLTQPDIRLRMFDAVAAPVLSYACQVWGPWLFHGKLDTPLQACSEKVQLDFVRIMAGAGKQCNRELLLHEYCRYPIMWQWVKLAVRFWNRLRAPGSEHKLAGQALRGDVELMLSGCQQCWAYKFLNTLTALGVLAHEEWQPGGEGQLQVCDILAIQLCEEDVVGRLEDKWEDRLAQAKVDALDPRSAACTSAQVAYATYARYVRADNLALRPAYHLATNLSFGQVQCISRFRLGWHDLAVQQGRYTRVPRQQRVCLVCEAVGTHGTDGPAPIEDLLHFVVECPSLQVVRDRFPALFTPAALSWADAHVHCRYIMNHKDQAQVAAALVALSKYRTRCQQLCSEGRAHEVLQPGHAVEDQALQRLIAVNNFHALSEAEQEALWY